MLSERQLLTSIRSLQYTENKFIYHCWTEINDANNISVTMRRGSNYESIFESISVIRNKQ